MTYAFATQCDSHNKLTLNNISFNGLKMLYHFNRHLSYMCSLILPRNVIPHHDYALIPSVIRNEEDILHINAALAFKKATNKLVWLIPYMRAY